MSVVDVGNRASQDNLALHESGRAKTSRRRRCWQQVVIQRQVDQAERKHEKSTRKYDREQWQVRNATFSGCVARIRFNGAASTYNDVIYVVIIIVCVTIFVGCALEQASSISVAQTR